MPLAKSSTSTASISMTASMMSRSTAAVWSVTVGQLPVGMGAEALPPVELKSKRPPPPPPSIMIMSMASCLTTRQTVWAGRKTETAQQTMGQDVPIAVEATWLAGAHADRWHDEAIARLPVFTHDD